MENGWGFVSDTDESAHSAQLDDSVLKICFHLVQPDFFSELMSELALI